MTLLDWSADIQLWTEPANASKHRVALATCLRFAGNNGDARICRNEGHVEAHLGGEIVENQAYEYDGQLSDEIGPGLIGGPRYLKAVKWNVNNFKQLGLSPPCDEFEPASEPRIQPQPNFAANFKYRFKKAAVKVWRVGANSA